MSRAIAFYKQHQLPFALPEPLLLRARIEARAGDAAGAMRDLQEGMAIVERGLGGPGDAPIGTGMLNADHALFTDAIRLSLDRGDNAGAFAFSERSRGGSDTIPALQSRLSGSGMAVIEIVTLPKEMVTFTVTGNDFRAGRHQRGTGSLNGLAERSISEDGTAAASALYDQLIRPVDSVLARAREIVIIPDAALRTAAFAALYDASTRQYLIERFAVAVATSSTSLAREATHTGTPILAAITLPSAGGTDSAALPEAARS